MNYPNTTQLCEFLRSDGLLIRAEKVDVIVDGEAFQKHKAELIQQGLPSAEIEDHAAFICLTNDRELTPKTESLRPAQILAQQDQLLKVFTAEQTAARLADQQRETQHQFRHHALVSQIATVNQATEELRS